MGFPFNVPQGLKRDIEDEPWKVENKIYPFSDQILFSVGFWEIA